MNNISGLYAVLACLSLILITIATLECTIVALDSVSRARLKQIIEEENSRRGQIGLKLVDRPLKYHFSNKLISIILIIFSYKLLILLPYNLYLCIAIWLGFLIVFGVLLPSKVALLHKEAIVLRTSYAVNILLFLTLPFFYLARAIVNLVLIICKQDINIEERDFSEEEILSMLEVGKARGIIKEEGQKMISSIFNFDDELAYEIMTPRTDVFAIDILDPTSEYIDKLMELRYSRIPVYQDDYDNIIGILNIKDYLIKARESGFDKVDITGILRKPYFVPDTKNIDSLFFELQKSKQHIAILIDEYGGFSGIVTMEDLIEEIVGDIDDEYDEEVHVVEQLDECNYIVDGNVDLDDLSEDYGIELESDNSETIGGFIIDLLGEIPEEKDLDTPIEYSNYILSILSLKDRRVEQVKVHVVNETEEENGQHQ